MKLLATEGRAGAAEVEIDGQRLRVVDELSPADAPRRPGRLESAKLVVEVNPHLSRRLERKETHAPGLEADHGWRYRAGAKILSTRPLRADLGTLQLDLELPGTTPWRTGARVSLAIDRIVLSPR